MRLIITRHGETEENVAGIVMGHLPGKLTQEGISQAKKVALRLQNEKIDYIYSSDLARAADTAKEIVKYHPDTPITFTKALREKNFGEFQGKKKSDFGWTAEYFKIKFAAPKGGETREQVYSRAKKFLHMILTKHNKDTTILLVGHNSINKNIIAVITGKTYEDVRDMENQHNTSITVFEIDEDEDKNNTIDTFNCIKHLE